MTLTQAGKRSLIAGLAAAALLAGCGSDHDDGNQPPASSSPPPAATDAFFSYVSQLVATQNDTAEPVSIDAVAATSPDDTEPQPLPGP